MTSFLDGESQESNDAQANYIEQVHRNPLAQYASAYLIALAVFFVGYYTHIPYASETLRFSGGILAFIALPGLLLTKLILPRNHWNASSFILLGLVLAIAEVQSLFVIVSFLAIRIPLAHWLMLIGTLVYFVFMIGLRKQLEPISSLFMINWNSRLFQIVAIAFVIRLTLFVASQGAMGTDSAFYADFGRAIVTGEFQSSVLNDSAILSTYDNVSYISHQAFAYVFSISWMIWPVGVSGPSIILVIVGTLILPPFNMLCERYFDRNAAMWQTFILAILPVFVFHSSIGYGPEILTLFMLIWCVALLEECGFSIATVALMAGVVIGFIDAVWFSNFYVICFILPLVFAQKRNRLQVSWITITTTLVFVVIARLYYTSVLIFLIGWLAAFAIPMITQRLIGDVAATSLYPFLIGIFSIMMLWRLPVQIAALHSNSQIPPLGVNPLIASFLEPLPLEDIGSFIAYLLLHVTPVVIILALLSLKRGEFKQQSGLFLILSLLISFATLRILSVVDPSLNLRYLFSDSRFFLSIAAFFIISAGSYIAVLATDDGRFSRRLIWHSRTIEIRNVVIAAVLIISIAPGIYMMPSGITLVQIEERYGWMGLTSLLYPFGDSDSVFLVNRAREFSWFTGRKSAALLFSSTGLSFADASSEMLSNLLDFETQYLLMDSYTTTKWNTSHFLQYAAINIGSSVLIDIPSIAGHQNANNSGITEGLRLLAATNPNSYGRIARVYSLVDTRFIRVNSQDLGYTDWEASNEATISNVLGSMEVRLSPEAESTTISYRENMDWVTVEGFVLIHLELLGASDASIRILGENGRLIGYADYIGNDSFFCPIGVDVIDDIHISIRSSPGHSIFVHSISFWTEEVVPP